MKSKWIFAVFLLFALSSLAQAQCIASGGQISCDIPGATVTGTGVTQLLTLPGTLKVTSSSGLGGSIVSPYAISLYDDAGGDGFGFLDSNSNIQGEINIGAGTTARNIGFNFLGVSGANGVNDNVFTLRFNGSSNKIFMGDMGSGPGAFIHAVHNLALTSSTTLGTAATPQVLLSTNTVAIYGTINLPAVATFQSSGIAFGVNLTVAGSGPGTAGGGLVLGACNATLGCLYSNALTPSTVNYALQAGATTTQINAPTGGTVYFSINDGSGGTGSSFQYNKATGIFPTVDTGISLGGPSNRWDKGYFVTTSVGTSSTSGSLNIGGNLYWSGYASVSSALSGAVCMSATNLVEINTNVSGCLVSALKYKTNISAIHPKDALGLVLNMRPVTYDLREDETNHQFGFIADWAETLHPGLATYDRKGDISGFRYEQYTAYLTGAIQALNARIDTLEKR